MSLRLITPPASEPITLVEAKAHLRVDHAYDDAIIQLYLSAARQHIDGYDGWLGRAIMPQTWELALDCFPADGTIRLPLPPLQSVTSVKYDDVAGDEQTMPPTDYSVDAKSQPGWVVMNSGGWPTTWTGINSVRITYIAGYASAAEVPAAIKAAILLMLGNLYENRSDVVIGRTAVVMPFAAQVLLLPLQVFSH